MTVMEICGKCSTQFAIGTWHSCGPAEFVKADADKPRLDLLPRAALEAMGRAFGYGAKKYAPGNWRKCDDAGRYVAAAMRHLIAWNDGEERDAESGLSHLDHAIASLAMLIDLTEDPHAGKAAKP